VSLALAALAGLCLASPSEAAARVVAVHVLQRLHPTVLQLSGPQVHQLQASGETLEVDGRPVVQPWEAPVAEWRLSLPGEAPRRYTGALSVRAVDGELALVLGLPLESYLALVVASETVPGTPPEALRAQAVVARSFLLAQGPRHPDADVCDLAHCQVLRGSGVPAAHRAAARAAALSTEGRVLLLSSGAVAETPFHAACGGHTGNPEEVFGSAGTGAEAVADSGCPRPGRPRCRFLASKRPSALFCPTRHTPASPSRRRFAFSPARAVTSSGWWGRREKAHEETRWRARWTERWGGAR
jgi:stage II sporulation protein D